MTSKVKTTGRILSIVLAVLFMMELLPTQTMAAFWSDHSAEKQRQEKLLTEPKEIKAEEKAAIVSEDESQRDEYTKVYRRADGTYTAYVSTTPLHYKKNGKWKEIDNTLTERKGELKNTAAPLGVTLPKTVGNSEEVSVKNGKYALSFSMEGIESSKARVTNNMGSASSEEKALDTAAKKTAAGVIYNNIAEKTDLQYVVSGDKLKENIILNDQSAVQVEYSFIVDANGLSATKDDSGNIQFRDSNGKVRFTIPRPVMYDSNKDVSYDISVRLEAKQDGAVRVIFAPSAEWLRAENRAYPVTIDPDIELGGTSFVHSANIATSTKTPSGADTNFPGDGLSLVCSNKQMSEDNNDDIQTAKILVQFDPSQLNVFSRKDIIISEAQYILTGGVADGSICARGLNGSWNPTTVTYHTLYPANGSTPSVTADSEVLDYYTGEYEASSAKTPVIHFELTGIMNEWLNGTRANNGFMIESCDDAAYSLLFMDGSMTVGSQTTYFSTYLVFDFVDTNAVASAHTQDAGRAGTVSVNDLARTLSVQRNDLSLPGNLMPAEIAFNYNSSLNSFMHMAFSAGGESMPTNPYGKNWLPSYESYLAPIGDTEFMYFTASGLSVTFKETQTKDANGAITGITFESKEGSGGYELSLLNPALLQDNTGNLKITTPEGYTETFYDDSEFLQAITDPNYANASINITYINENSEDPTFPTIDYVTDGIGRKYDFVYDSTTGMLSSVDCLSASGTPITGGTTTTPLRTTYAYNTTGELTTVTFADGKSVHYTYDANENLTSVQNINNYLLSYTYDAGGRVSSVPMCVLTKNGNKVTVGDSMTVASAGALKTQFSTSSGNIIEQFDRQGKLLYTINGNGCYGVGSAKADTLCSQNLLQNPSFEERSPLSEAPRYWNNRFSTLATTDSYIGSDVLDVLKTRASTSLLEQDVNVSEGGNYTFSAYVKSVTQGHLVLRITSLDNSNTETATQFVQVEETGGKWLRYSVVLNAPDSTKKIAVFLGFENSKGEYYVDAAQLEKGSGSSSYNYLENGSFNALDGSALAGWNGSTVTTESAVVNGENTNAVVLGGGQEHFVASGSSFVKTSSVTSLSRTIAVNAKKGDAFSLSGFFKGCLAGNDTGLSMDSIFENCRSVTFPKNRYAQLELSYTYTETIPATESTPESTQQVTETVAVPFAQAVSSWQFATDTFELKGDCSQISVALMYQNYAPTARFANVALTKAYSASGNAEASDEPIENINPANSYSNQTTNDAFGNVISTQSYDGIDYIGTSTAYTANGNYVQSQTNENGGTVTFDYNVLNGVLQAIHDARNNTTSFSYDVVGEQTNSSAAVSDYGSSTSSTAAVGYGYTNDDLTSVTVGGETYNLSYNNWGQIVSVSLGSTTLISYTYGTGCNCSRINTVTYYNGQGQETVYSYFYNNAGNVVRIQVNGETKYSYTYDDTGVLTSVETVDSRTVEYYEGHTDILDADGDLIYTSGKDNGGNVTETISDNTYTTTSYPSEYNSTSGITTNKNDVAGSNGKVLGNISASDWFGRKKYSLVKTEGANDANSSNTFAAVKTEYTYPEYTGNKTSLRTASLVNKIYHGTEVTDTNYSAYNGLVYDYDGNGNITAEWSVNAGGTTVLRYQYDYDQLNELTRVNDAVQQKTFVYDYDTAGNILSKTEYPYSLGNNNPGTANAVSSFGYDATWKDKLTSFNGGAISYDAIGNPTSYRGATLTWCGRELESYSKDGKTTQFSYDENGLRYRKTVYENNVLLEQYDYVWAGGRLISQTHMTYSNGVVSSTDIAKFNYNDSGELLGFILNNSASYLYVRNLQGDIIGLVGENGQQILTYSYDAWGAISFTTNSQGNMALAVRLANVSPFTYRGYCYDYDIELYYLQSRYYDPQICRFINADSTDYLGASGTLLSYNLYAYCENEPMDRLDASGTSKQPKNLEEYIKSTYFSKKENKNGKRTAWNGGNLELIVAGNVINIYADFYFKGDLAEKNLGGQGQYLYLFMNGIRKYWKGQYNVFGCPVSLRVYTYLKYNSSAININMKDKYGVSSESRTYSWSYKNCGSITLYKGDTRGRYANKPYNLGQFYWVSAHEFGHILGTSDMGNNTEGTIMGQFNNSVTELDLRRVLEAFIKNTWITWG